MDDFEFEIEWIPEESSTPYEIDMANVVIDTPSHIVDKLCKKKYGHTNWARMGVMSHEHVASQFSFRKNIQTLSYLHFRYVFLIAPWSALLYSETNILDTSKQNQKLQDHIAYRQPDRFH